MKTKIFVLFAALLFSAASLTAQEVKTMYVMKDGAITYKAAVSDIDSIIFYKPAPVIPEDGVLINGVVWAKYNVDAPGTFAAKPEDPGMFYQWNRKIAWPVTGSVTNWDATIPEGTEWEKVNDPSPTGWHVPTFDEINTLLDTEKVNNKKTTRNGISGIKFTDKITGNSIFLPAVGLRYDIGGNLVFAGSDGAYWSSMPGECLDTGAYSLSFGYDYACWYCDYRVFGFNVRCVAD